MVVVCCLAATETVVVDAVDPSLPPSPSHPLTALPRPPVVPSTDTHPCHVSRAQHLVANGVAEAACGRMQDAQWQWQGDLFAASSALHEHA